MACLENYIGIRGECASANLYLDDLPGIDIISGTNFTNETLPRPINLVTKAFNQAQKEVLADVLSKTSRNYNRLIEDKTFGSAGTYAYTGLTSEQVKIKVWKKGTDKFIQLHVDGFEIVSDREATVDFVVSDAYGVTDTITVDLDIGLNEIPLDVITNSESITITFDLDLFKMGMRESYAHEQRSTCMPCETTGYCNCSYVDVNKNVGFNLTVRCEADECKIIKYLSPTIDLPLLYKTGINYLLEAKMSGRTNAYLKNKSEDIENVLNMWMGGYNAQTGTTVSSQYWQKVKQVADQVEVMIRKLQSFVFTHEGSSVSNHLP